MRRVFIGYIMMACVSLLLLSCSEKRKTLLNHSSKYDELISQVDCYSLNEKSNEQSLYYSYQVNYGLTGRIDYFDLVDYLGWRGRMKYEYSDGVVGIHYRYKENSPFFEGYAAVMDDRIVETSVYDGKYAADYFYDAFGHLEKAVNLDGEELIYEWDKSKLSSISYYPEGCDSLAGFQTRLNLKYKKISAKGLNLDLAHLFCVDMILNCGSGICFSDTMMEMCGFAGARCLYLPDSAELLDSRSETKVSYRFLYGMHKGTVEDIIIMRNGQKIFRFEISYIKNPAQFL